MVNRNKIQNMTINWIKVTKFNLKKIKKHDLVLFADIDNNEVVTHKLIDAQDVKTIKAEAWYTHFFILPNPPSPKFGSSPKSGLRNEGFNK